MSLQTNQVSSDKRLAGFPIVGNPTLALNTLQFDSVNNQFIWVAAATGGVSEVEFLQARSAAGELRHMNGNLVNATGTLISVVPPAGTTTVIFKAQFVQKIDATGDWEVDIRINAVVIETVNLSAGNSPPAFQSPFFFLTKGAQLIGDGAAAIEMRVVAQTSLTNLNGNMELYDLP